MTETGGVRPALAPAGIAALAAAMILARQREFGPVFPWDGVNYVCAAGNLLAGGGLVGCGGDPMTAWAPLYPALLALASLPGFDPREVAGPLGAAFFGVFVFVAGLWLRRRLESRFLAVWGCLAVALSAPLTQVFSSAMSEPPFLLFAALALIWADRRLEDGRAASLAWAAAFAALACATRYAGVMVAAVVVLALLLERGPSPGRKAWSIWLYMAIAAAPTGVWMARNLVGYGWPIARPAEVDYSFSEAFAEIARTIGGWALPDGALHGVVGAAVLLLLAAGAGCAAARALPRTARPRERAFLLFGGFALAYVVFYAWTTVSGRTWHGVQQRHLLPVYVPILFSALLAADRLIGAGRRLDGGKGRAWRRAPALVLAAACVLWLAPGAYPQIRDTLRGDLPGRGYEHPRWAGSEVVRYLRGDAPDGVVWANDVTPLHFFAGGAARYAGLTAGKPIGVTVASDRPDADLTRWLRRSARSGDLVVWLRDRATDSPFDYDAGDVYALPEARLLAALEDGLVFRIDKAAGDRRNLPPAPPARGRAPFDVLFRAWDGRARLVVVERPCGGGGAPFLLRVWPARAADLPAGRRERGFEEFDFEPNRAGYGSMCVSAAALPEYAAARASIGRRAGGDPLWRAEFRPRRGDLETLLAPWRGPVEDAAPPAARAGPGPAPDRYDAELVPPPE